MRDQRHRDCNLPSPEPMKVVPIVELGYMAHSVKGRKMMVLGMMCNKVDLDLVVLMMADEVWDDLLLSVVAESVHNMEMSSRGNCPSLSYRLVRSKDNHLTVDAECLPWSWSPTWGVKLPTMVAPQGGKCCERHFSAKPVHLRGGTSDMCRRVFA